MIFGHVNNVSYLYFKKMNLVVLSKIDLTGVMLIIGGVFSRDRAEQRYKTMYSFIQ